MGKQFHQLSDEHTAFIARQKIYFVATAAAEGRVNLSPKGMDSLRVLGPQRVVWLNLTGSGNETAAHVALNPRMTVMFCAFEGAPLILRLYGKARLVQRGDADWETLLAHFEPLPGTRQLFDLCIDLVQSSCGMAVPNYTYGGDRELLTEWAVQKGPDGLRRYWEERNRFSLDGFPTHIIRP